MDIICRRGKRIQVLKSCAGYYLGTLEDGCPYCRCSTEYAPTKEEAEKNLFIDRFNAIENRMCNEGKGCIDYGNC